MKTLSILLLTILSFQFCFSQKSIYLNGNDTIILNANQKLNFDYTKLIPTLIDNSKGTKTYQLVKRSLKKTLSNTEYYTLVNNLTKITNQTIDSTKNIVVNYHHERDNYLGDYSSLRFLKSQDLFLKNNLINETTQYHIYANNSVASKKKRYKKFWFKDTIDFLKKNYFPYSFNFGSFLILKPNKEIFIYYGEYSYLQIAYIINVNKPLNRIIKENGFYTKKLNWKNISNPKKFHKFLIKE